MSRIPNGRCLQPIFFPAGAVVRAGPKETPERVRRYLNALRYLNKTGCQWRMLPGEFPPRSTVHDALPRWTASGLWPRINAALREKARLAEKKRQPQRRHHREPKPQMRRHRSHLQQPGIRAWPSES